MPITKPTPASAAKNSQGPLWISLLVVLLGLASWLIFRAPRAVDESANTSVTSCNAVSTVNQPMIDPVDSAATGNVVISYSLTNTVETGLNCFLLATVKDSSGTQVGTWRRSFYHSAPGTYQEHHDIGEIPYHDGETLTVTIIKAEGSATFSN